jgi:hypothetical protein
MKDFETRTREENRELLQLTSKTETSERIHLALQPDTSSNLRDLYPLLSRDSYRMSPLAEW